MRRSDYLIDVSETIKYLNKVEFNIEMDGTCKSLSGSQVTICGA